MLEKELEQKDKLDEQNGLAERLSSRVRDERDDTDDRSRLKILNDIRLKLEEYGMYP